jgi:pilus assembly protein Flp/PilA
MKMSLTEMGQGMVEYAFIIMLVAIVIIAAVTILGPTVGRLFSSVNTKL